MVKKKHSLSNRYKRFFLNERTAMIAAAVSTRQHPRSGSPRD